EKLVFITKVIDHKNGFSLMRSLQNNELFVGLRKYTCGRTIRRLQSRMILSQTYQKLIKLKHRFLFLIAFVAPAQLRPVKSSSVLRIRHISFPFEGREFFRPSFSHGF